MGMAIASSFRRIDAAALRKALDGPRLPLVLDVRRRSAFEERPERIPGAVPLALDAETIRVPDLPRHRSIVAYCLCGGETSSARVARWLAQEGYRDVAVLKGGLQAWIDAGHELEPLDPEAGRRAVQWKEVDLAAPAEAASRVALTPDTAFLPRIAGQGFLDGRELPTRRNMVPVFVDMVESTELVLHRSPEQVLGILQAFMEVVIDIGVYHCGDVHDFEGDGALLCFEGVGEAVPAAFRLREDLVARRRAEPDLPLPRISLDAGPIVVGIVGTRFRQTVALVGPAVHRAARILKRAPPGGIIATEPILEDARRIAPELASQFRLAEHEFVLDERHPEPAALWVAPRPDR